MLINISISSSLYLTQPSKEPSKSPTPLPSAPPSKSPTDRPTSKVCAADTWLLNHTTSVLSYTWVLKTNLSLFLSFYYFLAHRSTILFTHTWTNHCRTILLSYQFTNSFGTSHSINMAKFITDYIIFSDGLSLGIPFGISFGQSDIKSYKSKSNWACTKSDTAAYFEGGT